MIRPRRKIRACLTLLGGVFLFGCGGERGEPDLRVEGAWVRPAQVEVGEDGAPTMANSAAYLRLENRGSLDDRFLGGETVVARSVELHESFMEGDVMRMRGVEAVEVPRGATLELKPGGLHLMLLDLNRSLIPGDTVTLTLRFQIAGKVEIGVPVQSSGGM